ncbi:MAG: DNA polymerase III subunit delta [Bacteroidales bacterium]|nr:DNA polymerase III subunit delta [Bacteroidales bacterium]
MAKQPAPNVDTIARDLVKDAKCGIFKPIYLLMGDEPYYIDLVCDAVLDNCIEESERDFNQVVCYGSDVNAESVVTAARRFPMFAMRSLVVVKEAQLMKDVENLSYYCENPLDSTVLVIGMKGAKADKRRALYKSCAKNGVIVESTVLKDSEVPGWITRYFAGRGLSIAPDAAGLLSEYAGADLAKIAVETDKMVRNIPEGKKDISLEDIEQNVGISRQYTIFELTKALNAHNAPKSMKIASNIAAAPKFAIPMATAMLFSNFQKVLKVGAGLQRRMSESQIASELGIAPYFMREYTAAARYYPVPKCMQIISLLREYDFRGKGGEGEATSAEELFNELITKILIV